MPILSATPLVNAAVARARDLPGLIASLPPTLAQQLEAKPLLLAKSPPAVMVATGLAWASTRYGLGWDDGTCALLSGIVLTGVAYAMRAITKQPTSGLLTVTPPAVADGAVPGVPVSMAGEKP